MWSRWDFGYPTITLGHGTAPPVAWGTNPPPGILALRLE